MTKADLYAYIKTQKLGVLSYLGPRGTPQSALVGVAATPDLEIVFDTVKSSRKYACLAANPAAAFVIGCGPEEKTLQFEGIAREPSPNQIDHYKTIYFATWADGPARQTWPGICYFVVEPKWIRFTNYDKTPTLLQEFTF